MYFAKIITKTFCEKINIKCKEASIILIQGSKVSQHIVEILFLKVYFSTVFFLLLILH